MAGQFGTERLLASKVGPLFLRSFVVPPCLEPATTCLTVAGEGAFLMQKVGNERAIQQGRSSEPMLRWSVRLRSAPAQRVRTRGTARLGVRGVHPPGRCAR